MAGGGSRGGKMWPWEVISKVYGGGEVLEGVRDGEDRAGKGDSIV